mgnify:CR=1 FL=1
MRELKRRGLSSTGNDDKENQKLEDESRARATAALPKKTFGSFDETVQVDQRKQSMALNSEGLEVNL